MEQVGTILGGWAHADDEAWLSAGVMAQAVRDGFRLALGGEFLRLAEEARA